MFRSASSLGAVPVSHLSKRLRPSGREGHARFRHLFLHSGQDWIVRIPLLFSCLFFAVSHRDDPIRIEEPILVNLEQAHGFGGIAGSATFVNM
jgi:hypothetical protein